MKKNEVAEVTLYKEIRTDIERMAKEHIKKEDEKRHEQFMWSLGRSLGYKPSINISSALISGGVE